MLRKTTINQVPASDRKARSGSANAAVRGRNALRGMVPRRRRRLERAKRVDPFTDDIEALVDGAKKRLDARDAQQARDEESRRTKKREFRERVKSYLTPGQSLRPPGARAWARYSVDESEPDGNQQAENRVDARASREQLADEGLRREFEVWKRLKRGANPSRRRDKLPAMIKRGTSRLSSTPSSTDICRSRTRIEQARERDLRLGLTSTSLVGSPTRRASSPSKGKPQEIQERRSFVRAMFDLKGAESSDLSLQSGDIIDVTRESDDGWHYGTNLRSGQSGHFPINFVSPCGTPQQEAAREEAALRAGERAADDCGPTSQGPSRSEERMRASKYRGGRAESASRPNRPSATCVQESQAAVKLQSAQRRSRAMRVAAAKRAEKAAATKLQAVHRGQIARGRVRALQKSHQQRATRAQALTPGDAATKVQSARRGQLARREFKENKAATKLQAVRRGQLARERVKLCQKPAPDASAAATKVQSARRGQLARRQFRENKAATKLQAIRRGQLAREQVRGLQSRTQRSSVESRPLNPGLAATKLQAARRGQIARRQFQENKAATKLQAVRRGQLARGRVRLIQEWQHLDPEASMAAVKVQSARRRQVARRQLHETRAATKLQAARRGQLARGRARVIKEWHNPAPEANSAAIRLQSARRAQVARRQFRDTKAATVRVQAFLRGNVARLLTDELKRQNVRQQSGITLRQLEDWDDEVEDELEFVDPTVVQMHGPAITPLAATEGSGFNVSILPSISYVDNYTPDSARAFEE